MHPEALRAPLETSGEHFQLEGPVMGIYQGISTSAMLKIHKM
jgi:hypothetical protein